MPSRGLSTKHQKWLERARIPLRIGCVDDDGWPLIASLWFLPEDGLLWCATPEHARIVGHLRREARCGVEIATHVAPYSGLRMRAQASIVTDRGDEILRRLLDRYLGDRESDLARWLLDRSSEEIALRLEPTRVTHWDYGERMGGQAPFHA